MDGLDREAVVTAAAVDFDRLDAPMQDHHLRAAAGSHAPREPGEIKERRYFCGDRGTRHAEIAPIDPQVLRNGEIGIEVVELRHHAYALPRFARTGRHGLAEELDVASIRIGEAEAEAQRRGLAGAVRTEEPEALARRDVEIDAAHDFQRAIALAQPDRAHDAHAQWARTSPRRICSLR